MRIRRKYLFYVLGFASAIITALVASIDAIISNQYIQDPWALGLACFLVGVPLTFVIILIFSIPIGSKSLGNRFIDPSFHRVRLPTIQETKYHLMAGLGNATLTLGYFFVLSIFDDPSVVLPFSQIVILYLLIIESVTEKNIPTLSEVQSSVIVTFGAILGSISFTGTFSWEAMAVVFLIINPGWVLFSIYQRKLKLLRIKDYPNDSLNIRFWNVVFACLISIIMIMIVDIAQGTHYFQSALTAVEEYYNWVMLTMLFTFFSYVFFIRALGIGKASVTQAIRSSTIIFIIPFSVVLASIGIIQPFSTDPSLLIVKTIGIILILLGIISFALTLVKAYIFIEIKPGYSIQETMQNLWKISGVTRVAATAGTYDIMVKIHTRTLVKGYERILKKIEELDAVQEYKWESVLKEWENI
jgi:DNA-binding Lrp family transcriptional regulator